MKASCLKVAKLRDGSLDPDNSSSSRLAPRLWCLLVREVAVGCVLDYSQTHILELQGGRDIFNAILFPEGFLRYQVGPQTKLQNGTWGLRS